MLLNTGLAITRSSKSAKAEMFWNVEYLKFLLTRGCSTNTFVIKSVSESSFVKISSTNLHSVTVRARELKFWEKVHFPPPVICHVSHVTCHVSRVTCHMSHVRCHMIFFFFFYKFVKFVDRGSEINGATPSSFW